LVLWQLDTNKQQHLPHLTAAIEGITVSPSGKSYGLRLNDNSIMVLSTSELAPTAVIAGVQTTISELSRKSSSKKAKQPPTPLQTPAVLNQTAPHQLLLAVPASQSIHSDYVPAPFLQTFDWTTGRHVSRQALARNNATVNNTAADGTPVREANVTLMKQSPDGMWLATAEEWTPTTDSRFGEFDAQAQRRETYLKFWRWDVKESRWTLDARIDSPHQSESSSWANRILDLDADPSKQSFASIGQDGVLRIWKPKTQLSDGRIVKGIKEKGITTWVCSRVVPIGRSIESSQLEGKSPSDSPPPVAKLSFSDDGSALAVSLDDSDALALGLVHFVDTATGTIKASQPLVYGTRLCGLHFLGRYLVVLSTELRVWDVVSNKLVYGYEFKRHPMIWREGLYQLAASRTSSRFIVSFPVLNNRQCSRIAIFDPISAQPLLIEDLPTLATAFISLSDCGGFAVIDNEAEIRIVKPNTTSILDPIQLGMVMDSEISEEAFVDSAIAMPDMDEAVDEVMADVDGDSEDDEDDQEPKPLVRSHQLAEIFKSSPSFALPPVQDLFRAVASLYIGKPPKS
jgi:NET1-associated nuclear protein 1 (U3 small nucleolar RNA-associated protein 17)